MSPAQIIQLLTLLSPMLAKLLEALHRHPDTPAEIKPLVPAMNAQQLELHALLERVRSIEAA